MRAPSGLLRAQLSLAQAGADVANRTPEALQSGGADQRIASLRRFGSSNMDLTRAFYEHSKILVAALNGPAIGARARFLEARESAAERVHRSLSWLVPLESCVRDY